MYFFLSTNGLSTKFFTYNLQGELFLAANKSGYRSRSQLQEKPSAVCSEELVSHESISVWVFHGNQEGGPDLVPWGSRWWSVTAHNSAMPRKIKVYRAGLGKFPSPAAPASQQTRELSFCLSREGKEMHCSILCHPSMALCPPIPLDALQIALAFGLCSHSDK